MKMNQHPHPDDERLSALAAADDDARSDAALRAHVSACDRCRGVVDELTSLRTHLAAMPDLVPPRPIRIVLPPREAAPAGFAQLVRRLFAPALAAGATLAIIGGVGLSSSSLGLGGAASVPTSAEAANEARIDIMASSVAEESVAAAAGEGGGAGGVAAASDGAESRSSTIEAPSAGSDDASSGDPEPHTGVFPSDGATGSSGTPWLPLFVAGVALAGIALFLRFAVVPRAG
ncbi:MAG: hypothetical protein ABI534_04880 [Chloroflexota bacterium]